MHHCLPPRQIFDISSFHSVLTILLMSEVQCTRQVLESY